MKPKLIQNAPPKRQLFLKSNERLCINRLCRAIFVPRRSGQMYCTECRPKRTKNDE